MPTAHSNDHDSHAYGSVTSKKRKRFFDHQKMRKDRVNYKRSKYTNNNNNNNNQNNNNNKNDNDWVNANNNNSEYNKKRSGKIQKMIKKWKLYSNGWEPVAQTNLIPIRVPLSSHSSSFILKDFCREQQNSANRKISWIIDLTNVMDEALYYGERDIPDGVSRIRIKCPGHDTAPSLSQTNQFLSAVEDCLRKTPTDFILVHCTHGLNRTGFLLCEYLLNKGICSSVSEAIQAFQDARKETITKNYVLHELDRRHSTTTTTKTRITAVGAQNSAVSATMTTTTMEKKMEAIDVMKQKETMTTLLKSEGTSIVREKDSLVSKQESKVTTNEQTKRNKKPKGKKKKKLRSK